MAKCGSCGQELEIGDFPFCPHGSVFERNANFSPIVIHQDAEGNVSFPGRSDVPPRPGYQRVELNTTAEVRAFERQYNQRMRAEHYAGREEKEQIESAITAQRRSDLRMAMQGMSRFGRDFARIAMEKSNDKRRGTFDPGFRVSVLSE